MTCSPPPPIHSGGCSSWTARGLLIGRAASVLDRLDAVVGSTPSALHHEIRLGFPESALDVLERQHRPAIVDRIRGAAPSRRTPARAPHLTAAAASHERVTRSGASASGLAVTALHFHGAVGAERLNWPENAGIVAIPNRRQSLPPAVARCRAGGITEGGPHSAAGSSVHTPASSALSAPAANTNTAVTSSSRAEA